MLRKQWVVKVFILIICGFSACSGPGTPDLPDGKSTTDSNGFEVGLDSQIDVEQDNIADGTADVVSVSKLEALPNPANPLSFYVTWETSSPVIGQVMVNCGDELTGEITASTPATEHEVYIMGLWEGATCKVAVGPASGRDEATLEWTVEPLGSPYPELTLQVLDKELVAPGWTLFNLSNKFDKIPLLVVIVDEQGRYRWVHRRAGSSSGAATSTVMIEDGILVGGTFDSGRIWPALIDYESHLVWEEKWDMHHDLRPDGPNYFLFVGNAPKGTCPPDVPDSDALFRAERGSSEIVWNWQFCNHYIPLSSSGDWDHVNAVVPFPNGTALLFSARGQGALFKVDRDSGEIVWRMGKNGGFDFQGGTQRPFHKQHAPEFTADNRILLFDNGREPDLMRSGAVEIDFDEVGLTYKTVWSYYPDPPIFADIWGDADRLLNGNTLVTFGQRDKTLDSDIQEVTEDGEVVWHLSTPLKWGWYRADRVEPLPPGFFVE